MSYNTKALNTLYTDEMVNDRRTDPSVLLKKMAEVAKSENPGITNFEARRIVINYMDEIMSGYANRATAARLDIAC